MKRKRIKTQDKGLTLLRLLKTALLMELIITTSNNNYGRTNDKVSHSPAILICQYGTVKWFATGSTSCLHAANPIIYRTPAPNSEAEPWTIRAQRIINGAKWSADMQRDSSCRKRTRHPSCLHNCYGEMRDVEEGGRLERGRYLLKR